MINAVAKSLDDEWPEYHMRLVLKSLATLNDCRDFPWENHNALSGGGNKIFVCPRKTDILRIGTYTDIVRLNASGKATKRLLQPTTL